jgi:hypothetical protein
MIIVTGILTNFVLDGADLLNVKLRMAYISCVETFLSLLGLKPATDAFSGKSGWNIEECSLFLQLRLYIYIRCLVHVSQDMSAS